ncbi:hypothetical protein C4D60_Mb10t06520 [Musa balbisiana]|uniref:Uncharacterized protein n=1 Tax=Musa balbisiana TaxID=52838 RepID=A0A4S8IWH2_MUSBA|nr:hypothetical protein C4D60_Mb10t06520 [Musa balbisiana]
MSKCTRGLLTRAVSLLRSLYTLCISSPTLAAATLRSVLRRNRLLPLFETCHLRDRLFFSSSVDAAAVTVGGTMSPDPHFMVEYLMNSCGFSPSEAAKVSKPLAHLRATEKPDAVLNFMRSQGFDGAGIRKMISADPRYLCYNVEKNLAPKFQFLRDLDLSESDIVDAIMNNHAILRLNVHRSIVPKLKMWESLLGSRELVLKHLKKSGWFFYSSVEKTLHPNLKFSRDECGIPEERLSLVLRSHPRLISGWCSPNDIKLLPLHEVVAPSGRNANWRWSGFGPVDCSPLRRDGVPWVETLPARGWSFACKNGLRQVIPDFGPSNEQLYVDSVWPPTLVGWDSAFDQLGLGEYLSGIRRHRPERSGWSCRIVSWYGT